MTELDEMGKLVDINTMIDKWTDPYFGRGRGGERALAVGWAGLLSLRVGWFVWDVGLVGY